MPGGCRGDAREIPGRHGHDAGVVFAGRRGDGMQLHTYSHVGLIRSILDRDTSEIPTQPCWHGLNKPGQDFGTQTIPCPCAVHVENPQGYLNTHCMSCSGAVTARAADPEGNGLAQVQELLNSHSFWEPPKREEWGQIKACTEQPARSSVGRSVRRQTQYYCHPAVNQPSSQLQSTFASSCSLRVTGHHVLKD